ncbi:MAG: ATP-binding protein [Thermomicrobiales bacterium]
MAYNPFDKSIGSPLESTDLAVLVSRSVAEGYFVEYKGIFPGNEKIGRSLASFANTYGGWYIVGVITDGHNVATEVPGFDPTLASDPIAKVREIAKTHIDPLPVIFPQVVTLASGKIVVLVYIPGDQDTPFISRDGRVYRRNHDASDPVPETNRYAMDRLVEQGRDARRRFKRFCKDTRTFSRGEDGQAWVHLYLAPAPPLVVTDKSDTEDRRRTQRAAERLLERSRQPTVILPSELGLTTEQPITGNSPFDTALPTHESTILRQHAGISRAYNSLSVELFEDGRAKLFIPIHAMNVLQDIDQVESSRVRSVLRSLEGDDNSYLLRFLDVAQLWAGVAILVAFYRDWIRDEFGAAGPSSIKVAIRLVSAWRAVPFFDHDAWGEHVEKVGLPVILADDIRVPSELGRAIEYPWDDNLLNLTLGSIINETLGLPVEINSLALVRALIRYGLKVENS